MTQITVIRVIEYRQTKIYILHIADVFQYVFHFRGQLYTDYVYYPTAWYRSIAYRFGLIQNKNLFTDADKEQASEVVAGGAFKSINALYDAADTK